MRLIGGNISDTPVKEIGDGSAFNVGGGGSVMPSLPTLDTPSAITTVTATNWVTHAGGQSGSFNGAFVTGTVKLSDTLGTRGRRERFGPLQSRIPPALWAHQTLPRILVRILQTTLLVPCF